MCSIKVKDGDPKSAVEPHRYPEGDLLRTPEKDGREHVVLKDEHPRIEEIKQPTKQGIWKYEDAGQKVTEESGASPRSELERAYKSGRLAHAALKAEAGESPVDPKLTQRLSALEKKWMKFYDEHKDPSQEEMMKKVESFAFMVVFTVYVGDDREEVSTAPWSDSDIKSLLKNISPEDLAKLYKIALVGEFMQEEGIEYKKGASFSELIGEDQVGDCNMLSTLTLHLGQMIGLDDIDVHTPPGHANLSIRLKDGRRIFFDNASNFLKEDAYRGTDQNFWAGEPWDIVHTIHSDKASVLTMEGKYAEAIEEMNKCLALRPTWRAGIRFMGSLYQRSGDYKKALEYLSKIHTPGERDSVLEYYLAETYIGLKNLDKAKEHIDAALAISDSSGTFRYIKAKILYLQGDIEGARRECKQSLTERNVRLADAEKLLNEIENSKS
ncbi:MAG: tetratricopeptide repeat protein [Deltaproteobacteria bacterium]|jgi:tetratricopeptide (TPR) repeat protein|nr:tetratricopeptide repeat protein [Deltaproteobacteria bacterium]